MEKTAILKIILNLYILNKKSILLIARLIKQKERKIEMKISDIFKGRLTIMRSIKIDTRRIRKGREMSIR